MPSSEIIPKERLSAWSRWELAALASDAAHGSAGNGSDEAALSAEREALTEQARAQGYAEGCAMAGEERARLAALCGAFTQAVAEQEQRVADEVLDLALLVARQMVGDALAVRRDFLLPGVRAALRQLPHATQRIELCVHPVDLPVLAAFLPSEPLGSRCHLTPDPGLTPGGCRVETEQCDIDATVESRWQHLMTALGRPNDWLRAE